MEPSTRISSYYNLASGFVAQNVAVGLTYGCFGLIIDPVVRDLGASRSVISWAIGLVILLYGLLGPVTGLLLDRWSVAKTMIVGCILGALGFYLSAHATSAVAFTLCFGLIVGAGHSLIGVLPATTLANAWFPQSRGRAIGFVNVPVLIGVGPPLYAYILLLHGWRALLQDFGLIFAGVSVLALFVSVPDGGLKKPGVLHHFKQGTPSTSTGLGASPYKRKVFWIISSAEGMLVSSGIVCVTYIASYAIDNGINPVNAAILLSIFGIGSSLGALLFGWMCDRLTPFNAMMLNGSLQCLLWILLLCFTKFVSLAFVVGALALCMGGVATVAMTMLGRAMPSNVFGLAVGQMMFAMIPFIFFAAPLAGALRDWRGNYLPAFTFESVVCGLCVMHLSYFRRELYAL